MGIKHEEGKHDFCKYHRKLVMDYVFIATHIKVQVKQPHAGIILPGMNPPPIDRLHS